MPERIAREEIERDAALTTRRLAQETRSAGLGETVVRLMRARTARGVNVRGRRFASYARSTARQKGRRQPVTRWARGDMMNSLHARPPRRSAGQAFKVGLAEVTFASRRMEKRARRHIEGTRHMPRRDFFGVTTRESRVLRGELELIQRRTIPRDRRRRTKIQLINA